MISETLRRHPSVPFLNRICLEDFDVPDSNFRIKKGTGVMISVSGLHHNPNYYPDPDKFDPLRFTKENIAKRPPYTYLAFGEGPRYCIGKVTLKYCKKFCYMLEIILQERSLELYSRKLL